MRNTQTLGIPIWNPGRLCKSVCAAENVWERGRSLIHKHLSLFKVILHRCFHYLPI